ncbi:hypothetical protein [Profundibacter amoris]|uniref:hypothetical protein n=1 Tax=Profundibacter amoris TaxID=2171755 RepID=UPI0013C2BA8D|nr:hypothetical protein [Profundibacter amoris]
MRKRRCGSNCSQSGTPIQRSIANRTRQIKMTPKTSFTRFALGGFRAHLDMRRSCQMFTCLPL